MVFPGITEAKVTFILLNTGNFSVSVWNHEKKFNCTKRFSISDRQRYTAHLNSRVKIKYITTTMQYK